MSNQDRPLQTGMDLITYKKLAWGSLFGAIFCAFVVSVDVFYFITFFIGNYWLYSMPPMRLKRVPVFSKFIIAFNSFLMALLGFVLSGQIFPDFPVEVMLLLLVGFTLVINFIDLKDVAGDRAEGIKTLPVLLGMRMSQYLIALFFVGLYGAFYLLFALPDWSLGLIVPAGLAQVYFVTQKKYQEQPVFLTYLIAFFVFLIIYSFN